MMKSWMLSWPLMLAVLLAGTADLAAAKKDTKDAEQLTVAGVTFAQPPKNWVVQKPKNQMRVAQWQVEPPKPEKDAKPLEPGEVVIFYFGPGQGGGPKDNLERWRRRISAADGSAIRGEASQRDVDGMRVHELVAYGTYAGGMPQPGFKPVLKPDWALVGVVIETSKGNVFVRYTGPKALVKPDLVEFEKWLDASTKAVPPPPEENAGEEKK